MPAPAERLDLMRQGERFFLAQLERVADLSAPCALPGWSRAHLVAHVARNADALSNLVTWARTGVETPMYASDAAREAGIESSAQQTPDLLRADVAASSTRLLEAMMALSDDAWDAEVRTRRGRVIPASEIVWMRIREVWVHAVDLDAGATFADLPEVVVLDFVHEVANGLMGREDCPAMEVDIGTTAWRVGPVVADPVVVRGAASDVLAWLLGRAPLPGAPTPPAWL